MQSIKSERMNICVIGRTNVGKSTVINRIIGQDVSIISDLPGTTTDPVNKRFELIPAGPVTFFDTPGYDDESTLAQQRVSATLKVIFHSDLAILVLDHTGLAEKDLFYIQKLQQMNMPFIVLWNKADLAPIDQTTHQYCEKNNITLLEYPFLKDELIKTISHLKQQNQAYIIRDLLSPGDQIVQVMPIDDAAPAGRIILPQVMVLREVLDATAVGVCCTEKELSHTLSLLSQKPALVITDSQAVDIVTQTISPDTLMTTYSILFARYKGDLSVFLEGLSALKSLKPDDEVLIWESCSHNVTHSDIGEVKIPNWLKKHLGFAVRTTKLGGSDYPDDLQKYKMVIHCGGCMATRTEILRRVHLCTRAGIPITNYGLIICQMQGCLPRAIEIFQRKNGDDTIQFPSGANVGAGFQPARNINPEDTI